MQIPCRKEKMDSKSLQSTGPLQTCKPSYCIAGSCLRIGFSWSTILYAVPVRSLSKSSQVQYTQSLISNVDIYLLQIWRLYQRRMEYNPFTRREGIIIYSRPSHASNVEAMKSYAARRLALFFIGSVCRQRLCINFSVSRVNFLTTLRSLECFMLFLVLFI